MLLLICGPIGGAIARFHRIHHGRTSNGGRTTNIKTIPDLDAVYTLNLKIAQDRRLQIYQTCSFAIVLFNTMPSEALVRVVKIHRKDWETKVFIRYKTSASHSRYTRVQFY